MPTKRKSKANPKVVETPITISLAKRALVLDSIARPPLYKCDVCSQDCCSTLRLKLETTDICRVCTHCLRDFVNVMEQQGEAYRAPVPDPKSDVIPESEEHEHS